MTDNTTEMLDTGLAALAREVREGSPRPGPDLMARVLADAAAVSAERAPLATETPRRGAAGGPSLGLRDLLFGWNAGAAAALTICLAIGFAVGMEMEDTLLTLDDADGTEIADGTDTMFQSEDFL